MLDDTLLFVYITHFIDPHESLARAKQRTKMLATEIFYLSEINVRSLEITIFSNKPINHFAELSKPVLARGDRSKIYNYVATEYEISQFGLVNNWLLTWVHKSKMRQDVNAGKNDVSILYLYLEDDALFTEANLRYFVGHLPDMKRLGLIPGFVRSEWSYIHNCWTHVDAFSKIDFNTDVLDCPFNSNFKLVQQNNPYSASILLDQSLAEEYLDSESSRKEVACYKHPVIFDIGSTAALGLICERVPKGYKNRTAVISNASNAYPTPGSVIRHLDDRYGNDIWQKHFQLYDDKFSTPLRASRTIWDYFKRLKNPDRFHVLRRFIGKLCK